MKNSISGMSQSTKTISYFQCSYSVFSDFHQKICYVVSQKEKQNKIIFIFWDEQNTVPTTAAGWSTTVHMHIQQNTFLPHNMQQKYILMYDHNKNVFDAVWPVMTISFVNVCKITSWFCGMTWQNEALLCFWPFDQLKT